LSPAVAYAIYRRRSEDEATTNGHASDPIAIGARAYPREDVPNILGGRLDALPNKVRETARIPLGTYRGLGFGIVLHSQFSPEIYLEGATTRIATLSRDHQGPRAVLNALERLAGGYGSECDRVKRDLGIAESQLRDYQGRLGNPFPHDAYLAELTALRDQLKAGLSSATPEPGKQEGPSVAELSERIRAIKAANTIEATPQRIGQRQSSAEEPITARIRRKTEGATASDPIAESNVTEESGGVSQEGSAENLSLDAPKTFQERLAAERQSKDDGPSPP
jgi:hypothetical protein